MRILMLNNEFPPLGGGTGTVNHAILQQFSQVEQFEVDLVTSSGNSTSQGEPFSKNIHIYQLPVKWKNIHHASNSELIDYAFRSYWFARKLHKENPYQLCFAWSAVPAGGTALALRKMSGLPYLVRVCGPDIPGFEQRYGALYPILTPLIRAIWRGAEVVVAKCKGEADMIHAVDPQIDVKLVPNGVDMHKFKPGSPLPDDGSLKLLCVGRLIERKGQRYLIQAVKQLVDEGMQVTLDLVGSGDAVTEYKDLVRELDLLERVHFCGYVPREEIPKYYANAHVFVLPSYNEGMSVATLEAMASGLPLVVTRTGGTAELVEEGVNGFTFDWGDVYALIDQLTLLSNNHRIIRIMGEASRKKAKSLSWESPAQRFIDLFSKLVVAS